MELAVYFKSPGHVKVLQTLFALSRPLCFRDLVDFSGVSISSAQNALNLFKELQLVKSSRCGQELRFCLRPHKDLKLLGEIFKLAASRPPPARVLPGGLKVLRAIERANRLAAGVKGHA